MASLDNNPRNQSLAPVGSGKGRILTNAESAAWAKLPYNLKNQIEINDLTGCWVWKGTKFDTGYGAIHTPFKLWKAHRYIWTLVNGAIAPKIHCLHKCDNKPCVNAAEHLFLGTNKDNHQDKARKRRHPKQQLTECPRGHAYSFENTYYDPDGHRHCRTCKRMAPAEPWIPLELGPYIKERRAKYIAARRKAK